MTLSDLKIGSEFHLGHDLYRVTDVGTRVAVAIKIGPVVEVRKNGLPVRLTTAQAEAEGWLRGPPYAVRELVVDEDDLLTCEPAE